jgi:hypothetical protein
VSLNELLSGISIIAMGTLEEKAKSAQLLLQLLH